MRIAILGSGDVVAELAENVYTSELTLAAVGYAPENEQSASGLIHLAGRMGIPCLTNVSNLDDLAVDVVYLHNYPKLIPAAMLARRRFINMHYAPLPRYRGYHGLVWALINGEPLIGYTIHEVADGIDNGPILYQHLFSVSDNDTIHDVLGRIESHLREHIVHVLVRICRGQKGVPQDESKAIYVTRRKPEDGLIQWNMPSRRIHNMVRALTPPYTPGAFTYVNSEPLYVCRSRLLDSPSYFHTTGKVVRMYPGQGIWVKTGDTVLEINEVQFRGVKYRADELITRVGVALGETRIQYDHTAIVTHGNATY